MAEDERKKLLIVDDSEMDRVLLKAILGDSFEITETNNAYMAFEFLTKQVYLFDAVLLDISMPVMNGFDLLVLLKDRKVNLPPIFLMTAEATPENILKSKEFDIAEFIGKPFDRDEILKRLRTWLGMTMTYSLSAEDITASKKYIEQLKNVYKIYFQNFDLPDKHYTRMVELMRILLTRYMRDMAGSNLDKEKIDLISSAAYFCDIGNIMIPGKLNMALRDINKSQLSSQQHTEIGAKIVGLGNNKNCEYFIHVCADICLNHHERYDGMGFPRRVSGSRLSIYSQLCRLVDEFDTLFTKFYGDKVMQANLVLKRLVKDEGIVTPDLLALLSDCSHLIVDYYSKSR